MDVSIDAPENRAYLDRLIGDAPVQVVRVPGKGKGVVVGRAMEAGSVVVTEQPYACLQHLENEQCTVTCAHCMAFVGTMELQLARLAGAPPPELPGGPCALRPMVHCQRGCPELYCSERCREEAWEQHHRLLCLAGLDPEAHPLCVFVRHAAATNEMFLLVARIVARIVSEYQRNGGNFQDAVRPIALMCKRFWWEVVVAEEDVSPEDVPVVEAPYKRIVAESALLLCHGLCGRTPPSWKANAPEALQEAEGDLAASDLPPHECRAPGLEALPCFSVGFIAQVMGLFELNNISVDVPSPLCTLLPQVQHASGERRAAYDAALRPLVPLVRKAAALRQAEAEAAEAYDEDEAAAAVEAVEAAGAAGAAEAVEAEEAAEAAEAADATAAGSESSAAADAEFTPEDFPASEGAGVFPLLCTLNHSCEPNCRVRYDESTTALLTAVRDIAAGEELTISYIADDAPYSDRQEALRGYLFTCTCPKCEAERAAGGDASDRDSGYVADSGAEEDELREEEEEEGEESESEPESQ